ncbi:MAG: endo-1,4-beta-xylanase [Candidatus Azobacteroides sp.]|nr:endo-1,4-beta-xylanase [Candidatus Azobacteroides sp.]
MKYLFLSFITIFSLSGWKVQSQQSTTLKEAYAGKFLIGAAINTNIAGGRDTASLRLLKAEFNSIVAENCMKSENIQPKEGVFFFDDADQFVKCGEDNQMAIIGHTLIWHSQTPSWFFVDAEGKDVSSDELIRRMKNHITTVVERYKGRIKSWDVVNEAFLDDGSLRQTKFYNIIGEDYIKLAFEFARAADPDCELYYNDYAMAKEGKRNGVIQMVQKLKAAGVKVDGIGMQGHSGLDYPDLNEFEKSIVAYSKTGCKVSITEMDVTVLPIPMQNTGADVNLSVEYQQSLNPYADGLPAEIEDRFNARYCDFFELFLKHQDKIERVTLWGITDDSSWRNNWPIAGRTDYPLLFDRQYQPKPVVKDLILLAANCPGNENESEKMESE